MASAVGVRIGGHVVVDAIAACGAEAVFGLPGIHALAIWEGLRTGGHGLVTPGIARSSRQASRRMATPAPPGAPRRS